MIVKVKVTQSYLTLCDPMDYTVCEILQGIFPTQGQNPDFSRIALEFNESLSNLDVPPKKFAFLPESPVFT